MWSLFHLKKLYLIILKGIECALRPFQTFHGVESETLLPDVILFKSLSE